MVRHLISDSPAAADDGHSAAPNRLEMSGTGRVEMNPTAGQARKVAQAVESAQAISSSVMLLVFSVEQELAEREEDKQHLEIQLHTISQEAADLSVLLHQERTVSAELKCQNELQGVEIKGLLECVEQAQCNSQAHAAERAEWGAARSGMEQKLDTLIAGQTAPPGVDARVVELQAENSALMKRLAKIRSERSSTDKQINQLKLAHAQREQELQLVIETEQQQGSSLQLEVQLMKSVLNKSARAASFNTGGIELLQQEADLTMTKQVFCMHVSTGALGYLSVSYLPLNRCPRPSVCLLLGRTPALCRCAAFSATGTIWLVLLCCLSLCSRCCHAVTAQCALTAHCADSRAGSQPAQIAVRSLRDRRH